MSIQRRRFVPQWDQLTSRIVPSQGAMGAVAAMAPDAVDVGPADDATTNGLDPMDPQIVNDTEYTTAIPFFGVDAFS
jgi:hypothetical protein